MPTISKFNGITIRMYFLASEHNPPHIHAIYGEYVAAITITSGKVIEGYLPPRILKDVVEWLGMYQNELLRIWETQEYIQLPPL